MKLFEYFTHKISIFSKDKAHQHVLWKSLIYISLFSLFINILMLAPPLYMLQVYDRVMSSRSHETLFFISLILIWMFLTMGILEYVRSRILAHTAFSIDQHLAPRIFIAVHNNALKNPGHVNSHALNDLAAVRQFLSSSAPFAFFDMPWIPIYLSLLFLFDPLFGWFSIGSAVVLIILALLNELSTGKLQKKSSEYQYIASNMVSTTLRNSEVIQAMGMQENLKNRWKLQYEQALQGHSQVSDRSSFFVSLSKTLRMLFQSLILGLGAYLAINNNITAGMMIAGSIIMGRALAPIDQSIAIWKQFATARAAAQRLHQFLQQQPEVTDHMSLPEPEGHIKVNNIVVRPPGGKLYSLKGLSFELAAGESLAIIGSSAAGKSSLVRAILGLWPLTQGEVRLDNTEIQHWNMNELGSHIGYLPQDIELFDGTIAENIVRFGEIDHKKIIKAAKQVGIDSMIRHLPEGYDTAIGSDGTMLSGGQRQLIGLARAFYGQPKLVVLDEPNASLDSKGEKALSQACQKLKKQKTTLILVSHRKEILRIVDKILVLKDGNLKLYGPTSKVIAHLMRHKKTNSNTVDNHLPEGTARITGNNQMPNKRVANNNIPAGAARMAVIATKNRIEAAIVNSRKGNNQTAPILHSVATLSSNHCATTNLVGRKVNEA